MFKLFTIPFLALLLLPTTLLADNSSAQNDDWVYSVTPYLWVTGQKGDVATLPPAGATEIDVSFNDVISNMDLSMMGFFEARKGRLGLFSELFYVGISADADTPGNLYSKADYEQDLWALSVGASYAISQNKDYLVDALAGVRFWDLDNRLKLKSSSLPSAKKSHREHWQDAFIGLRGKRWLNEKWFISGWGITSIAGDSDSAWDVFGAIGYDYSDGVSFSVGYRHQEINYKKGDFLFDVKMSGPTIGATIRF